MKKSTLIAIIVASVLVITIPVAFYLIQKYKDELGE